MPKPEFIDKTTEEPNLKMTVTRLQSKNTATNVTTSRDTTRPSDTSTGTTVPQAPPLASSTCASPRSAVPNTTVVDSRIVCASTSAAARQDDDDCTPMSEGSQAQPESTVMEEHQTMSRTRSSSDKRKCFFFLWSFIQF